MVRCVNIDWLEVFCIETGARNADYFKRCGLKVNVRAYGTPQYREMFSVCDEKGEPFIEIRRSPYSLKSQGGIFEEGACHLRLVNIACYHSDPIGDLRNFIIQHGYRFQNISRVDICLDFRTFDDGADPSAFLADYATGKYFKQHLSKIAPHGVEVVGGNFEGHGVDKPYCREFNSWKWGAPSSAISVKLYNKSKELAEVREKSYIREQWLSAGLISHEDFLLMAEIRDQRYYIGQLSRHVSKARGLAKVDLKERLKEHQERLRSLMAKEKIIWRLEFSISSGIKGFVSGDPNDLDNYGKQRIYPLMLSTIDTRPKCLFLFYVLCKRYFLFKKATFTRSGSRQRKDRCPDYWPISWTDINATYKPARVVSQPQPSRMDKIIINKLRRIIDDNNKSPHLDSMQVRAIIDTLSYFRDLYHFDELNKVVDMALMYLPSTIKEDTALKEIELTKLQESLRKIDMLNDIYNV